MKSIRARDLALTAPASLYLAVFMIAPLLLILYVSTLERAPFGGVLWDSYSIAAYEKLLFERDFSGNLSFNGDYVSIFARSFRLAAITTLLTLAVSIPTASVSRVVMAASRKERAKMLT